jgi:hypothetical protein
MLDYFGVSIAPPPMEQHHEEALEELHAARARLQAKIEIGKERFQLDTPSALELIRGKLQSINELMNEAAADETAKQTLRNRDK